MNRPFADNRAAIAFLIVFLLPIAVPLALAFWR